MKARLCGARCRRVACNFSGEGGQHGGECRGRPMARGEEGWWAATLERGGERGWRPVGRGGERCGGVVALEHTVAVQTWWCGEWRETEDGPNERIWLGPVDERICKWRVLGWCCGPPTGAPIQTNVLRITLLFMKISIIWILYYTHLTNYRVMRQIQLNYLFVLTLIPPFIFLLLLVHLWAHINPCNCVVTKIIKTIYSHAHWLVILTTDHFAS
jgi:hypothetical protein